MSASDPHQVQAFADGQLSSADADRFRDHLGACEKCQLELHTLLQLDAAADGSKAAMPVPARAPRRTPSWLAPLLGLATAAGLAAFVLLRSGGDITLAGSRKLEARVGWSSGDAWRPYDAMRGSASADDIPLDELAKLQKKGDVAALAGAMLLSGDAQKARALLEKLDASPDVAADLSAVALAQGRPEDALELANSALERNPKHPRALWNSALAARELGFLAVAAKTFGEVAALNEPGWAKEAKDRQAALDRQWQEASKRYLDALEAGVKMTLEHTPMPQELIAAAPSTARIYLAYSMRTAKSADEARALLPVAKQLDGLLGPESRAVASIERAAGQPFEKRARLTALERAMFVDFFRGLARFGVAPKVPEAEPGLTDADRAEIGDLLERDGTADDMVLALPFLGYLPDELERYTRAAGEVNDPWFLFAAQNERAKAAAAKGDAAVAERGWLDVIAKGAKSAPLRVMQANELLALEYGDQHRAAEQQALIFGALPLTRAQNDVLAEGRLLSLLGDAARFRNLKGLAAAALEERALRLPGDCTAQRYFHESMALLHLYTLDANKMRTELKAARECGQSLSHVGVFALADLVRLSGNPEDLAFFDASIGEVKKSADSAEDAAMALHVEGRVRIDQDSAKGAALLRDAMEAARKLPSGSYRTKIPSYGYGMLRAEAGRQKRFEHVLSLTAEELGRDFPSTCALVVDVEDDRITVAAKDGTGAVLGDFVRVSLDKPHPQWVEVTEISAVVKPLAEKLLQGCATRGVSVFAGFPLNGQGGWLPDALPWSFASALPERSPVPGSRLVVSEVDAPREMQLPRLPARSRDVDGTVSLRGADATPERVLAGMQQASFVELEAHGVVNPGSEDAAMVVLAPGASGFALTVSKVRTARLDRHPIVLLGACKAATVAPYLHERWSLPHAFLEAGARAVIAAPVDLPDAEAREFFASLVDRLDSGVAPAVAVAEERSKWLSKGRASWVRAVLVFD